MIIDDDYQDVLEIGPDEAGKRLDKALFMRRPNLSRSFIKTMIQRGQVRVGRKVVKPSYLARVGDRIEIDMKKERAVARKVLEEIRVPLIYQDEHIIVLDKPPGIAVHPNSPKDKGTLSQWARWRFGDLPVADDDKDRPGIVHRLDRETSGVMVLARNPEALAELKSQFKQRLTKKKYLALVYGVPQFVSDHVDKQIARDLTHPERMRIVKEGGRASLTYWELLDDLGNWAWVACFPKTGRTHQIRVHMTSIGHSLLGDQHYRAPNSQRYPLPKDAPVLRRHALHATALTVRHPATQEEVTFESPVPADISDLLDWLRAKKKSG